MKDKIKALATDTAIYGFFTIVGRFLSFLLTPLYTNYLTQTEVAEITNIFSILAFINILNSFGMESAFFRFYSKESEEKTRKAFSISYLTIATISFITSFLIISFSAQIAINYIDLPSAQPLVILAGLIPFFDALMLIPYAYLRMVRNAKRFALTRFSLIVIAVALNIIFVVIFQFGALGVLIAQLIANIIGALLFIREIRKFLQFKIDKALFKEMLRFGLPTLPANFSAIILQVSDRPILKALATNTELAIYTVNHRLGIPMMLLVTVFEYAWKPFYLSNYQEKNAKELFARIFTYFTIVCSAIFLATTFYIEFIVRLPFIGGRFIHPSYWSGMHIIPLILGGYWLNGCFTNFAAGFHITKKTQYLPLAVGIGAIINIILNFTLIPFIGYFGSAVAMFSAYFSMSLILYIFSRKIYPIKYEWSRVFTIVAVSVLAVIISNIFTADLSLIYKFIIRTLILILIIVLIFVLKFFTISELNTLKSLFRKTKNQEIT